MKKKGWLVGTKVEVGTHTHNSISPASDSFFLLALSGGVAGSL